jgi:hypothetical protein
MAQIQLRDCTIRFKDGTHGNAVVGANVAANATSITVNTVNMAHATDAHVIPVGCRFTANTANYSTVHVVTGRTPAAASGGNTTAITISPIAGANGPLTNDVLTFTSCQIDVKIGEGNLTYTEHRDYKYTLDRGLLDTVKYGDEKPVDVKTDFLYEYVTTGTNEVITPVDAIKKIGGAAEWVTSAADTCEPYAVDIEVFHDLPCGGIQDETTTLSDFRYETLEFNLRDGTISVTGRCNVVEATVVRATV